MRTLIDPPTRPEVGTLDTARRSTRRQRASGLNRGGLPARPVYVTDAGLDRLLRQLTILVTLNRPEAVCRFREAATSDSGSRQALESTIEELTIVDGLIRRLRELIHDAVLIDFSPTADGTVSVGASVKLTTGFGQKTYRIVGWLEADPQMGLISNDSPPGEALLGRAPGDPVEWRSLEGVCTAAILSVEWPPDRPTVGPDFAVPSGPVHQGLWPIDRSSASDDHVAMLGWTSQQEAQPILTLPTALSDRAVYFWSGSYDGTPL